MEALIPPVAALILAGIFCLAYWRYRQITTAARANPIIREIWSITNHRIMGQAFTIDIGGSDNANYVQRIPIQLNLTHEGQNLEATIDMECSHYIGIQNGSTTGWYVMHFFKNPNEKVVWSTTTQLRDPCTLNEFMVMMLSATFFAISVVATIMTVL